MFQSGPLTQPLPRYLVGVRWHRSIGIQLRHTNKPRTFTSLIGRPEVAVPISALPFTRGCSTKLVWYHLPQITHIVVMWDGVCAQSAWSISSGAQWISARLQHVALWSEWKAPVDVPSAGSCVEGWDQSHQAIFGAARSWRGFRSRGSHREVPRVVPSRDDKRWVGVSVYLSSIKPWVTRPMYQADMTLVTSALMRNHRGRENIIFEI